MLSNYFKIALRNISRQKGFAALNIVGLAIGIAAMLLIFRIVTYELSFNKNFKNYDRIVRVVTDELQPDGEMAHTRGMPLPAMSETKGTVPQLVATAKTKEAWPTILVPNPSGGLALKKFNMDDDEISFFVEPSFFQVFDCQWLSGNPATALQEPNTVVLTRSMAEKCFGGWQNALGQTLLVENDPMPVRGVLEDFPVNCDFPVASFISYSTLLANKDKYEYREDWGSTSSNDQLFALLQDAGQLAAANAMVAKVGAKEYTENGASQRVSKSHHLQPLSELHYDDRYGTSATPVAEKSRLLVLSFIGLLVLVMACFNFINLSTAQALRRAKEVGVRKTLGGSRSTLFGQFMSETALIVCFSIGFGTVLACMAAPMLRYISDVPAEMRFWSQPQVWAFLAGLTVVVTLFSGFYPALVLTGFNPIRALKSNVSGSAVGNASVRKGLVVLQFVIAQALIVGTIITLGQLDYIRKMDLGFNKDLIYTFGINSDSLSQTKTGTFKQRLLQIPGVEMVALGSDQPSSGSTWMTNFRVGRGSEDQKFNTAIKFCDADYQKTYGIKILAGRWLEPSDTSREYVVNETLLKRAGISDPSAILGKEMRLGTQQWKKIVGVVKDFHSHSAHQDLEPLTLTSSRRRYGGAGVKIQPQNMAATTAAIQALFDETFPEQVFDATYFDESIADFYTAENRFSATCKGFAGLAILIACLGLLGLATHAAQQRTKEIGIRKVLGASVGSISNLLVRDFLQLVLIAIFIASPIAYLLMDKWLADFAYRIDIQWWMFAVAGLAALLIAALTVGFQSVKAALADPVKSLRSE